MATYSLKLLLEYVCIAVYEQVTTKKNYVIWILFSVRLLKHLQRNSGFQFFMKLKLVVLLGH